MGEHGSVRDIKFKDYTSSSNLSGIPGSSGLWSKDRIENTRYIYQTIQVYEESNYPTGWDEARVRQILAHYEEQTEDQAVAEDEAAFQDPPRPGLFPL